MAGNHRSGRRWSKESKPVAEYCVSLNISLLLREDALVDGTQGVLKWEDHFGWHKNALAYHMRGDVLDIDYTIRDQNVAQSITIDHIPLYWNNGTSRPRFLCPQCKRGAYILYATGRQAEMYCHRCSDLSYESQTLHHADLYYMLWHSQRVVRRNHDKEREKERKKAARRKTPTVNPKG